MLDSLFYKTPKGMIELRPHHVVQFVEWLFEEDIDESILNNHRHHYGENFVRETLKIYNRILSGDGKVFIHNGLDSLCENCEDYEDICNWEDELDRMGIPETFSICGFEVGKTYHTRTFLRMAKKRYSAHTEKKLRRIKAENQ